MLRRLAAADHPAAVWTGAVEPWLREHGVNWRVRRAILVPDSAWAAALKSQAVVAGLPVLGVRWLTPGQWRSQALRALPGPPLRLALREDLHLLLETAAAGLPENPLARAYRNDAAPFQEILDALDGAGWEHAELADPSACEFAARAAALRAQAGWTTAAAADRALRAAAFAGRLPLSADHLLAAGFGPAHWPLRPLLEAAALAAADTALVLDFPRNDKNEKDEVIFYTWIASWEDASGLTAETLEPPPDAPAPFAALAGGLRDETETSAPLPPSATPRLWLAENVQGEADAVVAQALAFLGGTPDGEAARVGVVVGPVNSPLAREVAARLAALDVPFHDAPGHPPGRAPAQALFEAWLDWQEDGRLAGLLGWARAALRHWLLEPRVFSDLEKALKDSAAATLSDAPEVLSSWLRAASTDSAPAPGAMEFLDAWPHVADNVSWDAMMSGILAASVRLVWPDPPGALAERANALGRAFPPGAVWPRAAVLRWVRAVTRVPGRTRDARAREPFAPLQITDAASAAAQPWSHLILAGLQHGEWPADDDDAPLLAADAIAALNRRVLRPSRHGEGATPVVEPGRALLLSAADRRRLGRVQFERLVGLPARGLALASRRRHPADGRQGRLSEYFWAVATRVFGRIPDDNDLAVLVRATAAARATLPAPSAPPPDDASPPEATARAFATRRDASAPFDKFSFCLASPPPEPLRLSCKNWENALARPGATWFQRMLRVEKMWDPAEDDFAAMSLGNWAHAWASPAARQNANPPESAPLPALAAWLHLAEQRAENVRARAAAAFAAANRALPERWLDLWAHAARAAGEWITALDTVRGDWPHALAEAALPRGFSAKLPAGGIALPLTGRMDLVLLGAPGALAPGGLAGAAVWLFDFKTGADKPLSLKRLANGTGLQLALYALALRELGAGGVQLSLLTRGAEARAQLTAEDLSDPDIGGLWAVLAEFAAGRWGEYNDLAGEHARPGDHPSATLPVPAPVLRKKWNLTHTEYLL